MGLNKVKEPAGIRRRIKRQVTNNIGSIEVFPDFIA